MLGLGLDDSDCFNNVIIVIIFRAYSPCSDQQTMRDSVIVLFWMATTLV